MTAWWASLSERDRRLGIIALLGLVGLVVWLALWRPLTSGRAVWNERAQRAAAELQWMRQAANDALSLRAQAPAAPTAARGDRSLLALTQQTAAAAGLGDAFRRGEAEGDERLRIWLENAPLDSLLRWLDQLQRSYAISVDDATLDRTEQPGIVNARLLLVAL